VICGLRRLPRQNSQLRENDSTPATQKACIVLLLSSRTLTNNCVTMRVSAALNTESAPDFGVPTGDPAVPDLGFLQRDLPKALESFFDTVNTLCADNPVSISRLQELMNRASTGQLAANERPELEQLKLQALRQGKAVGAAIGFFLKFKPYETFAEIRRRGALFQPAFGPVLVVEGDAVRDLLSRDQEFVVEPYGTEMIKVMSPAHNGGFSTFVLSTDEDAAYEPDKRLLSAVCNRDDASAITGIIHEDCVRRVGAALAAARERHANTIDVVQAAARYVPVTLGHRYLGVPVAQEAGAFELTPEMLACYGSPIDGQAETALGRHDGVIPDERQMYLWIKAAFQHFFNNVQKDPAVQAQGLRACRQLLAYLLREIAIQRERMTRGEPVEDTMLTRLVSFQLGRSTPRVPLPADLDPRLVSDLRIAENVMGTIVGAIAGQEEATCRAIDAMLRLQEGEYATSGASGTRYGSFAEARQLALNVMSGIEADESRARLREYAFEALRLEPQGEVLVRTCARDGARIAGSRPIAAGTLVFAAHGSAMKDVPEPNAFILGRPREHYLHYGWSRHTCLGQHVSPVIIVESMAAILALQDLRRPAPRAGEPSFPFERRFGRLQLDDQNLYATTFSVAFTDAGTTRQFWPAASPLSH
jgi:cytochrome P450